jgi:hypothetical protein
MEEKSISFSIIAIKTEQFAVLEEKISPKKEININTNLEFKINTEKHQFGVFSTFDFIQGNKHLIKLQVSCHFSIIKESWNSFLNENQLVFPKGFVKHLAVISIGTARGILHSKTEGTVYNTFVLPTINVDQIIENDVVFSIN